MPPNPNSKHYRTLEQHIRIGTRLSFAERRNARAIIRRIMRQQRTWSFSEGYPVMYVLG
jgi:hypothetical protein